jgi:hypothetical protein
MLRVEGRNCQYVSNAYLRRACQGVACNTMTGSSLALRLVLTSRGEIRVYEYVIGGDFPYSYTYSYTHISSEGRAPPARQQNDLSFASLTIPSNLFLVLESARQSGNTETD